MTLGLSFLTLGVADLPRARAFYEGLGLVAHARSSEGVCFFQLPQGLVLALFGAEDLARDAGVEGEPGARVTMACNLDSEAEVDELLARAAALGGRIARPAGWAPWRVYRGYVRDPDGHVWEVAFNPRARRDARGGLWLD